MMKQIQDRAIEWFESKPTLVTFREWCNNHVKAVVTFWAAWSAVAGVLMAMLLVGQILVWCE